MLRNAQSKLCVTSFEFDGTEFECPHPGGVIRGSLIDALYGQSWMNGRNGRNCAIEKVNRRGDIKERSDGIPCAFQGEVVRVTETSIAA